MTAELKWLLLTAIFGASLWIPYVIGINTSEFSGKKDLFDRPPDLSQMPAWVHRSHRAHLNLLEQLLPFSVVVLIAHMSKVSSPTTQWCVILFFWLRVAHAIGMISGKARLPVRPIIYVSGWALTLFLAWYVWANAK